MDSYAPTRSVRPAPALARPDFVGRARELSDLTRLASQPPAVVLVEGGSGVGKSRLVREFLTSRARGASRVVEAVCPPYREPFSLGPVVDALRDLTDSVDGLELTPLAGALRPIFPEWADDLPAAPESLPDATAARHRLFRALGELVRALDVSILVVEDVHWADEATLEFLLFLSASRRLDGLTLVLTYRPEEVTVDSLLLHLSRPAHDVDRHRIELVGLSRDETASLVSSMLDGREVTAEFADFLHQRTEGVPLAVEELLRLMHARADLTRHRGRWVRRHLDDIVVPPSIRDAVLERLGRLDADVREVLKAASVISDPADEATLMAVLGSQAAGAAAGLAVAIQAGWLQVDERRHLAFRHVLTCRAVYETIPDPQLRAMHLRAGRALESHVPASLPRLARHFREAGDITSWCRYAEQAADQAVASGDRMTATTLLNELIGTADLTPEHRARVARKLADAALFRQEEIDDLHVQVVATLEEVLTSVDLDLKDAAEIRERRGRLLLQLGELETGHRELERAIPDLEHEPVDAARAMTFLGFPLADPRPAAQHLEWLRRAARTAERVRAPAERLALTADRATALVLLGEESGWELADGLPLRSTQPDEQRQIARAHGNLGYAAIVWGRYRDAERRLAAAIELAVADDYQRMHANALATRARLDWCLGRWDRLAHVSAWAADRYDAQVRGGNSEWRVVDGLLDAANGSVSSAMEKLRLVIEEAAAFVVADLSLSAAAALARLELADGAVDAALATTGQPIEVLTRSGIWLWGTDVVPARVDALVRAGEVKAATELVDAYESGLGGRRAPAPLAALTTCHALLAEGRRDSAAADAYERAAAAWDALPRPYDACLARERRATHLIECGDTASAMKVLRRVFDGLTGIGARRDADRVAHAQRELGVEVARPWRGGRRGYGDTLSPRELDVAKLVVEGRTNREIGEALFVSPKTVARHLNSAMRKLKVSSRTALALRVVEATTPDGVVRTDDAS